MRTFLAGSGLRVRQSLPMAWPGEKPCAAGPLNGRPATPRLLGPPPREGGAAQRMSLALAGDSRSLWPRRGRGVPKPSWVSDGSAFLVSRSSLHSEMLGSVDDERWVLLVAGCRSGVPQSVLTPAACRGRYYGTACGSSINLYVL